MSKTDNDIYLCGIYLWNEDSPAYDVVNVDFFDILENDINFYEDLSDVYVCVDFNSRIGSKHDFIRNDDVNSFLTIQIIYPMNTTAGPLLIQRVIILVQSVRYL